MLGLRKLCVRTINNSKYYSDFLVPIFFINPSSCSPRAYLEASCNAHKMSVIVVSLVIN